MPPVASSKWRLWLKTNKVRVTALVFYGRREYVRVLDAYMKQNLNKNGGVLEEVTAEKHLFRTGVCSQHMHTLDMLKGGLHTGDLDCQNRQPTGHSMA